MISADSIQYRNRHHISNPNRAKWHINQLRKGAELPFLLYTGIFTYDKGSPHLYRSNNKDYNNGVERSR